jgi:hypothetical protein
MLKTRKITDHIVLVGADSQEDLGRAFLRFQEHYESPEWAGKIFTEGQVRSWYSEKYGANTYERDWSGFNVPGRVFKPFVQGLFDPLSEAEKELVSLFRLRTDDFYVIGSQKKASVLEHEICHGLYATVPSYRRAVDAVLEAHHAELRQVRTMLRMDMYHPSVLQDEVHAYVSSDSGYLARCGVAAPEKVKAKLRRIRSRCKTLE